MSNKYEMVCIAAVFLIILMSIPVQATITNVGVEKLIDIGTDVDPTYNPEGTKIVFTVSNFEDSSIWIFDLETRESYPINIPNTRHLFYSEWSPLGDKIVYMEGAYYGLTHKIYTNNLLGTNPICLTNNQDFSTQGGSFSHDESKIVYFSYLSKGVGDIWVMDVDGGNKVQLTNYQTVENEYNVLPSWSPDGSKIAFSSGVWPNAHIWVMNADGSNKIQLTDGSGFESYPAWSPDGRFIAYQKTDCADYCPWNVWIMKADGSEQTQLTNLAVDGIDGVSPDWHPNGNKLLFVSHGIENNIDWDIYEMTLGGINQPPLANAGGPYNINEGSTLTLDSTGSSDPDNNIILFEWDLDNDGLYDDATGVTTDIFFDDNGIYTIGLRVTDENNEVDSDTTTVTVNNVPPTVNAGSDAIINEGDTFSSSGSFSDPGADSWTATVNYGDGYGDQLLMLNPDMTFSLSYNYVDNGVYTITVTVRDDDGGEGSDTALVTVNNLAPSVGPITAPTVPVDISNLIMTSATFTDPGTNDAPFICTINYGDDLGEQAGTINGNTCTGPAYTYLEAGVYTIKLTVTDKDGDSGESIFQYVVVYDPDGGFVTGGGWIYSQLGAYRDDLYTEGKANFGFVSKYKKGANTPTGQTEFQFHAGNLDFHSTNYEWLVISGQRAQFKGTGTINGKGSYGFILTAFDGDLQNNAYNDDMFRIKIIDESDEPVYDNKRGTTIEFENAPLQPIDGGSIVIHKK